MELEIPYGKFPEYQRVLKELDHAEKVFNAARQAAQLAMETLIMKRQAHENFIESLDPKAQVIELRPYIEDIVA